MRRKSLILLFACLIFATACDEKSPVGPSIPLDREFTLAPGETAAIENASLQVQFVNVSGDSRCPADAVCIQGGDALVHIRATRASTVELNLHTGDLSKASATYAGFRIELVQLQPYPFSSRTIQPGEYRATLKVTQP
jgi:hypothetical protein